MPYELPLSLNGRQAYFLIFLEMENDFFFSDKMVEEEGTTMAPRRALLPP